MNMLFNTRATNRQGLIGIIVCTALLGWAPLQAATHTWQGPANGLWSNAANWNGGLPTTGESGGTIVQCGSNTTSVSDITNLVVDQIHFTGSNNTISGTSGIKLVLSSSVLGSNILNDSGNNALDFSLPLGLAGSNDIFFSVQGGKLTLKSTISGNNNVRINTVAGSSVAFLGSKTYTGTTEVSSGTLQLSSVGTDNAIAGPLIIGTGSGTGATVQLVFGFEIANTADVTVNSDGTFDLNNQGETIGALNVNGGTVKIGSGTLYAGPVTMNGGFITTGTLELNGDVVAGSPGGATITSKLNLNGNRLITVNPGAAQPELTISGVIANGSATSGFTKNGTGTLQLAGASSNTFTGTATIDRGEVIMQQTSGTAFSGVIVVGNASDAPGSAILQEAASGGLSSTVDLTVNASGKLELGGFADTVNSLTINDGVAELPSSTLTTGSLNMTGGSITNGANPSVGTLRLNGDPTITSSATQSATISTTLDLQDAARTFQIDDGPQGVDLLIARDIAGGAGGITKSGGGTMQFSSNGDFYTVASTVSAGWLDVTGALSSLTTVTGTGVLSGTGTVGSVVVNASTAAIAPSIGDFVRGTLRSTSNVTLGPGQLVLRINDASSPQHDELDVAAALDVTNAGLKVSNTGTLARNAYILATYGSLTGTFSLTTLPAGYSVVYDYPDGGPQHHLALVRNGMISTGGASSITISSAKLNGTIKPNSKPTSIFFQYGTTTGYGMQTPLVKNLNGSASLPQSATISGLNGATTYHYQLVATNADGTIYGPDVVFQTLGAATGTSAATNVQALSADFCGFTIPYVSPATVVFEYGLTPALGRKTSATVLPAGSSSVSVVTHVTGLLPDRIYYYRIAATNVLGTSRGDIVSFTTKVVLPPVLSAPLPASVMTITGAPVGFAVVAAGGSLSPTDAPLTYQWMLKGKAIPGANSFAYFPTASLTNAGAFTCLIKNIAGSITTPPAELGVLGFSNVPVINKATGSSQTLTVIAAGNYLACQWRHDGVNLANGTGKSLTLANLESSDSGSYTCIVTNPGGNQTWSAGTLNVFTLPPIILTPVAPAHGIVGGAYSYTIPIDSSSVHAPTSFVVKGMPAGLKVDSFGKITGRITAKQSVQQNYPLLITASNGAGSSAEVPATLAVDPYPMAANGTYNGTVDRDASNHQFGGSFTCTLSGIGSLTGKVVLAGAAHPFTGTFDAIVGNSQLNGLITVPGVGTMVLHPAIDGSGLTGLFNFPLSGNLTAYRNPWSTGTPFPRSGSFTSQFTIQDGGLLGDLNYPQGRGYASLTVKPDGTVIVTAKTADGSAPAPATFSTTVNSNGDFLAHFMLQGNTASVQGGASITPDLGSPVNAGQPLLSGGVDWYKAARPSASTDRIYKNGITLHNLNWLGGIYTHAANTPVLGLTPSNPGVNNARFSVAFGGLVNPEDIQLSRPLRITPTNTADFSNPADGNPKNMKLTINAATGAFSGSFTASSNRSVTFAGLLIPRTDIRAGAAYFLLPGTVPSITTSPVLSGEIVLLPP